MRFPLRLPHLAILAMAALVLTSAPLTADETAASLEARTQAACARALPATVQIVAFLPNDGESPTVEVPEPVRPLLEREGVLEKGDEGKVPIPTPSQVLRFLPVGSGCIFDADGLVLTNAHVVEALDQLRESGGLFGSEGGPFELAAVLHDGRRFPITVLGKDTLRDFAVCRLEGASDLVAFELGDSAALKPGDVVLGMGFPMGNQGFLSFFELPRQGLSKLGEGLERFGFQLPALPEDEVSRAVFQPNIAIGTVREVAGGTRFISTDVNTKDYTGSIETDLPIYSGNSGGPLVDLEGRLIGVNGAISRSASTLSFSIPMALIEPRLEALAAGNEEESDSEEEEEGPTPDVEEALEEMLSGTEGGQDPIRAHLTELYQGPTGGTVQLLRGFRLFGSDNAELIGSGLILEDGSVITTTDVLEPVPLTELAVKEFLLPRLEKEGWLGRQAAKLGARGLDFWKDQQQLWVRLPDQTLQPVRGTTENEEMGVARLDIGLDAYEDAFEVGNSSDLAPGSLIFTPGNQGLSGCGIVAAPDHPVAGMIRIPFLLSDLQEILQDTRAVWPPRVYPSVILHDSPLQKRALGAPLLDRKGRVVGLNAFAPVRGSSYALPIEDVLGAFKD